jgi:hypothetical protein
MGFFNSLLKQSPAVSCILPETHAVIRQMVNVLGFEVVGSGDRWARLAPAINSAVEYCDAQIALIPGPFDISSAQYTRHPLIHAVFPTRQDIAIGIGRSRDVKQPLAFLVGADQKEAFALMGVRRKTESEQPGGGAVFHDHTLRSLAANEAGARQGLRTAALTRVVTAFGEHIQKLRQAGSLPRAAWNIENRKDFPVAEGEKGKVILADDELTPDNLLQGLVAWLQRPSEFFQVRAGEKSAEGSQDALHQIDLLPQLLVCDRRRWVVCLVRFPTSEGVAAIQSETRQHRYILI